jgi:hypothetical protein
MFKDILNLLLVSFDPLIPSMRQLPRKKVTKFSREVLDMLLPTLEYIIQHETDTNNDTTSDSYDGSSF